MFYVLLQHGFALVLLSSHECANTTTSLQCVYTNQMAHFSCKVFLIVNSIGPVIPARKRSATIRLHPSEACPVPGNRQRRPFEPTSINLTKTC